MSKQPLNGKMNLLTVPKIQRMNSTMSVTSDDEGGLGYHHTLVSNLYNIFRCFGSWHFTFKRFMLQSFFNF